MYIDVLQALLYASYLRAYSGSNKLRIIHLDSVPFYAVHLD